jgi:RNA polymerase sigma-70 factor (ECF subfamily)
MLSYEYFLGLAFPLMSLSVQSPLCLPLLGLPSLTLVPSCGNEEEKRSCSNLSRKSAVARMLYFRAMASTHEVTGLLREWANGAQSALEELIPLVYAELHRLAQSYLRREAPGHTLQPTALVHEAFLSMVGRRAPDCRNRSVFYGVAARLMRQILVDHARTRQAVKRGGRVVHVSLEEDLIVSRERDADLVALDDALMRLAAIDPRKSQVVELRFFGGLSVEETTEVLKVSEKTVRRDWQFAKAWLLRELSGEGSDGPRTTARN